VLIFKSITYRNFLSTGNLPNTIELNKHNSTLITGKNGEGKSTILCALTFSLFGKPFRNISKNQLINSINKKNCLVEIEFETNGHSYIVKRGIKPNIFEIWCDGEMINQDAALKDYQKVLEQQILKLNYKTFTQVVILGAATFVPFMQLPSNARREVIEDILDIKVFTVMNVLLKEKLVGVKDRIVQIENDISNQKTRIQSQKKLIEVLESNRKQFIESIQAKIEANNKAIDTSTSQLEKASEGLDELRMRHDLYETVDEDLSKANTMITKTATNISTCEHNIEFFHNNTTCPSCSQKIDDHHKQVVVEEWSRKIREHQAKLDIMNTAADKLKEKLAASKALLDEMRTASIEISTINNRISTLNEQNAELSKEIDGYSGDSTDLTEEKQKMKQLAEDAIELVTVKSDLLDERQLHDVASALLKDTGIKTAIIREYLPVINKLINKYLTAMDFFIKFELDESFQEIIRSRGRDEFTYDSFSEGEKRRLDLAILFTWRQIAKMKNSVNTNLMVLDEILDGSLDTGGIDFFLSIMNQFGEQSNIFVISHKVDQMIERFDNVIRIEKKNDFSVIST